MYYFLAYFPDIDYSGINQIRKKYDPNCTFLDPHIAILFPVDGSIGEENLITHIHSITRDYAGFPIKISGLELSWDYYLYLTVTEGSENVIELHDKLYAGLLEQFWIKEVKYIPHITLGFFADKQAKFDKSDIDEVKFYKEKYEGAMHEVSLLDLNFSTTCNALHLVKRESKTSPAEIVKKFDLH